MNEGAVRAKLREGGGGGPELRVFAGPESPGGGGGGGGAERARIDPEGRCDTGGGPLGRPEAGRDMGIDADGLAAADSPLRSNGGGFVCFVSSAFSSLSKTWVASFSSSQSISMPPGFVFGAYGAGRVIAGAGADVAADAAPGRCGGDETEGSDPRGGPFEGDGDMLRGGCDEGAATGVLPEGGGALEDAAGGGMPMSVFLLIITGFFAGAAPSDCGAALFPDALEGVAAGVRTDDGGAGGGAEDWLFAFFLPRPSKISRSDPLFSAAIFPISCRAGRSDPFAISVLRLLLLLLLPDSSDGPLANSGNVRRMVCAISSRVATAWIL